MRRLTLALLLSLAATAISSAAPTTVSGQVLGPDGQPAAGVRVVATSRQGPALLGDTRSDATGNFAFPNLLPRDVYAMIALQPGRVLAWSSYEGSVVEGPLTLQLGADPVAFRGEVRDAAGHSVPDAVVALGGLTVIRQLPSGDRYTSSLRLWTANLLQTRSDAAGQFSFPDLPAQADVTVSLDAPGYGHVVERRDTYTPGSVERFGVSEPESTLAGRVLYQDRPLAGVQVNVGVGAGLLTASAVTAADGSYRVAGLSSASWPLTYTVALEHLPEGLLMPPVNELALKPGEHRLLDLQPLRGALVSGTVEDADTGLPVPQAEVYASQSGGGFYALFGTTRTDATGVFHLRLAPGKYAVAWSGFGHVVTPKEVKLEVAEGKEYDGVDFLLAAPPQLGGRVLLPDGSPAAGVQVAGRFRPAGQEGLAAVTGEDGSFVFPADSRFVAWWPPWGALALDAGRHLAGLAFAPGPEAPVTIRLAPAAYVSADFTDLQGQPVAGIALSIWADDARTGDGLTFPQEARSDAQGHLRLGPLPPGVKLNVMASQWVRNCALGDYWIEAAPITLTAGQELALPATRLNRAGRTLRGWVTDADQHPLAGIRLYARLPFGFAPSRAVTAADGHFELTGLQAAGKLWLAAARPDLRLIAVQEVDPDETPELHLVLRAPGSAVGQVLDAQGQPVAGALVSPILPQPVQGMVAWYLRYHVLPRGFWEGNYPASGADGRWRIDDLIPGLAYKLSGQYQAGDWKTYWERSVTAEPGQVMDLGQIQPPKPAPPSGAPGAAGPAPAP